MLCGCGIAGSILVCSASVVLVETVHGWQRLLPFGRHSKKGSGNEHKWVQFVECMLFSDVNNIMSECFSPRFRWLGLSLVLALPLSAAEKPIDKPIHATPLVPGPADGRIAFVTASMLEQVHYMKQPFDQTVS